MFWPKLTPQKIKHKVFDALSKNSNYRTENILGLPATYLDTEVFYDDLPFLKDAPFLSAMVANPNHIGCHTLETGGEEVFAGTQEIEKDLIRICAEEMFKAAPGQYDGYVASGGTEANIEALWIYRNYFQLEKNARLDEIAIVFSEDSHYSMHKASNLLSIQSIVFDVHENNRSVKIQDLEAKIEYALENGVKHFIVVLNLSTTMYGSVDDIDTICELFKLLRIDHKIHIDAAFGGFIYPFTNVDSKYNFLNSEVCSISLDGHKMLQAPYGTGIFLIRKHYMQYVCTAEATYVQGKDYTLCGSRSGANAVCLWMILHSHGSEGWAIKMNNLIERTNNVCNALFELGVQYFRNPFVNIVAIKSNFVSEELAQRYFLVPDKHDDDALWYKIVLMPHVKQEQIDSFLMELTIELNSK